MLFAVNHDVMNGTETVLNLLDALIARIEDGIHELEIAQADVLESSSWYKSCRRDRRNMLEKTAEASLHRAPRTRGPHLRRIEVEDENTAKSARSAANTPLHVLVENFGSDGALVKFALKAFATRAAWELCYGAGAYCTPPAFQIESPGGHGELPKLIDARVKEAAERGIEPRIVVITDCDGEWVGQVKEHAQGIRDKCAAAAIPCPPLNKRTVENYIPDATWRAWADEPRHTSARPAVVALLRLSYEQRDHVNIGPGNTPPWDPTKTEAAALFVNVSTQDRDLLRMANLKGRGSAGIASILETHKSVLTGAAFEARDRQGDLKTVVRSIEDGL